MRRAWYWFVRAIVKWLFFKGTGGLTVKGMKNVPRNGPLVIAPNHVSNLDPPVIACSIPRRITFMSKREFFKGVFGKLIASLGSFPVQRGEGDTEAIRTAIKLLEQGNAVLIFPEGTRGDGRTILPFNKGIAMLASRTGAPVLPVGIVGNQQKWPKAKSKPGWGRVVVEFGETLTYAEYAKGASERENREAFTQELSRRILDLCRRNGMDLRSGGSDSSSQTSDPDETAPEPQGQPRAGTQIRR
ncbi:MAG: lysophospholipid acyltransferase family protein [Fimbriimonadaceae bacterium]